MQHKPKGDGYAHWMATGGVRTGEVLADADLVWDVSNLGWPEQQIYSGPAGAMQFNAEWAAAWDDWEMEVEDYIDAGERVVVILRQRGRSKATGIPVDSIRLPACLRFPGLPFGRIS